MTECDNEVRELGILPTSAWFLREDQMFIMQLTQFGYFQECCSMWPGYPIYLETEEVFFRDVSSCHNGGGYSESKPASSNSTEVVQSVGNRKKA